VPPPKPAYVYQPPAIKLIHGSNDGRQNRFTIRRQLKRIDGQIAYMQETIRTHGTRDRYMGYQGDRAAEGYDHDEGVLNHLMSVRARIAAGDPIDPECWDLWRDHNSLKKQWNDLGAMGKVIAGTVAVPYVAVAAAHLIAALPTYAVYGAFAAVTEPIIDALSTRPTQKPKK
jgi:hypothetical protein